MHSTDRLDPGVTYDIWSCYACGTEYAFARSEEGKRGGPARRALDRRYGWLARCWNNNACKVNARKAGPMRCLLVGPGAPNPEQPVQDGLDEINAIIAQQQNKQERKRRNYAKPKNR
jgi:hypothetical protein